MFTNYHIISVFIHQTFVFNTPQSQTKIRFYYFYPDVLVHFVTFSKLVTCSLFQSEGMEIPPVSFCTSCLSECVKRKCVCVCVRDRLYGWHPAANRMLPQRKQEVTQPSNQRPRHLQETSAGVSTWFRLTTDFLTDTSNLFLSSNNLLTFLLHRLVCSGTGDSDPSLDRPPVVPLAFFSEVWLLIFP